MYQLKKRNLCELLRRVFAYLHLYTNKHKRRIYDEILPGNEKGTIFHF